MSDNTDENLNSPSEEIIVDAVFVIGTGSNNGNEELKYALRSLAKNCPFVRDVYISGECPEWVDTSIVKHLKWPDRFTHAKDANIIDKLRHACEQSGISKNILFCSDDQFQTRVCTWDDFAPRYLRQYTTTDHWYEERRRIWHSRLRRTLDRERARRVDSELDPSQVYYYQPHMWMQIDRDKFIEYAKWCDYEHRDDTIIASGYFNFADVKGRPNFDHVFISSNQSWPVSATHIAYSDPSFNAAMMYLKKEFSSPSKYEKCNINNTSPIHDRTDDEIIEDLYNKVKSEPAWTSLIPEIEEAERLRAENFVGWRKVWNDIIRRWSETTNKGKLRIPVVKSKNEEAKEICKAFANKSASETEKKDYKKEPVAETAASPSPGDDKKSEKKHCGKCEERRRKSKEEAEKRAAEAKSIAEEKIEEIKAASTLPSAPPATPVHPTSPIYPRPYGRPNFPVSFSRRGAGMPSQTACLDCALEHLSDAIAYMSSNAMRPEDFEIELAKGELRIAAQHLLALNRHEEYNRCILMLDSVYSVDSLFSVPELKDLLKKVLEGRFNH